MMVFDILDEDGSGHISQQEWDIAFDTLDVDGNGVITRKEWLKFSTDCGIFDAVPKRWYVQVTRVEWLAFFKSIDTDNNGFITQQEFFNHGFEVLPEDRTQNFHTARWDLPKTHVKMKGVDVKKEAQDRLFFAMAKKEVDELERAIAECAPLGINVHQARDVLSTLKKKQHQLKAQRASAQARAAARRNLEQAVSSGDAGQLEAAIAQGHAYKVQRDVMDQAVRALKATQGKETMYDTKVFCVTIPGHSEFRYPVTCPDSSRPHHAAVRDHLQDALNARSYERVLRAVRDACGPSHHLWTSKVCKCSYCQLPNELLFNCEKFMARLPRVEQMSVQESRKLLPFANQLAEQWYAKTLVKKGVLGHGQKLPEASYKTSEFTTIKVPHVGEFRYKNKTPKKQQAHHQAVQAALQDAVNCWSSEYIGRCVRDAACVEHPLFQEKLCKCEYCQFPSEVLDACSRRMLEVAGQQQQRSKEMGKLVASLCGNAGHLRVTLLWEDPCVLGLSASVLVHGTQARKTVSAAAPSNAGGRMDLVAEAAGEARGEGLARHVENIYWDDPPAGHYQITVSLNKIVVGPGLGASRSVPFQVQVSQAGGKTYDFCGRYGPRTKEVVAFEFTVPRTQGSQRPDIQGLKSPPPVPEDEPPSVAEEDADVSLAEELEQLLEALGPESKLDKKVSKPRRESDPTVAAEMLEDAAKILQEKLGLSAPQAPAAAKAAKAEKAAKADDPSAADASSAASASAAAEPSAEPEPSAAGDEESDDMGDMPTERLEAAQDLVDAPEPPGAASTAVVLAVPAAPAAARPGGRLQDDDAVPMEVTIVSAKDLNAIGRVDAYCVCRILGRKDIVTKTDVISNSYDPVWNHGPVEVSSYCLGDALEFEVRDKDYQRSDDILGSIVLASDRFAENGFDEEVLLDDLGKGLHAFLRIQIRVGAR